MTTVVGTGVGSDPVTTDFGGGNFNEWAGYVLGAHNGGAFVL